MKWRRFLLPALALVVSGCDRNREGVTRRVSELKDRAKAEIEDAARNQKEIQSSVESLSVLSRQLQGYIAEKDYECARAVAATMDEFVRSRTLRWYVDVLVVEEKEGVPAALARIQELRNTPDLKETEKAGLSGIEEVFRQKGDLRSLDAISLICGLIITANYGDTAGNLYFKGHSRLRGEPGTPTVKETMNEGVTPAPTPAGIDTSED
jgi:hypothetical protein